MNSSMREVIVRVKSDETIKRKALRLVCITGHVYSDVDETPKE